MSLDLDWIDHDRDRHVVITHQVLLFRSGLLGRGRPSADRPLAHVDNGPKIGLTPSTSWTDSDTGPRL